jgi:hypothetical protein
MPILHRCRSTARQRFSAIVLVSALLVPAGASAASAGIDAVAASPQSIAIGISTQVTIAARIANPALIRPSVTLLRAGADGRVLGIVGTMLDNGRSGDAIAGDRTFSRVVQLTGVSGKANHFRVFAVFGAAPWVALSPLLTVTAGTRLSVPIGATPETAAAAIALLTRDGGEITATGSNGNVYTLQVPFGALSSSTTITITPLTGVDNFPVSGPILGGVRLEPAGLTFERPITLKMTHGEGELPAGSFALHHRGTGSTLEAPPAEFAGNSAIVGLTHFSDTTLVLPPPGEYAQLILDLLAELPADFSASAIRNLLDFVLRGIEKYGPEFCGLGPDVCQRIYERALDELQEGMEASWALTQGFVAAGEPYSAYGALSGVIKVAAAITELQTLAEGLPLEPIGDALPGIQCALDHARSIISLAQAEGLDKALLTIVGTSPPEPLVTSPLLLLDNIAFDAAHLEAASISNAATAATATVLQKILADGIPLCATSPLDADAVLFRVLQLYGVSGLEGLEPQLGARFETAAEGCRVTIAPAAPQVAPEGTVQFSAVLVDPDGDRTEFTWDIVGESCGEVLPLSGLFTAGQSEGACTVRATFPETRVVGQLRRQFRQTATVTVCGAAAAAAGPQQAAQAAAAEAECAGLRVITGTASVRLFMAVGGAQLAPETSQPIAPDSGNLSASIPVTALNGAGATASASGSALGTVTLLGNEGLTMSGTVAGTYSASITDPDNPVGVVSSTQATLGVAFQLFAPHAFTLDLTPVFSDPSQIVRISSRFVQGGAILGELTSEGTLQGVFPPGVYSLVTVCVGRTINGPGEMSCAVSLSLTPQAGGS